MLQFNTIFLAFSFVGLLVALFYLVGLLFNWLISRVRFNTFLAQYYYVLCGMLLSGSLYAIVVTKGLTILLIVPVLLFFLTKRISRNQLLSYGFRSNKIILYSFLLFLSSIILYTAYYLQGFAVHGNTISYLHGDQNFYTRVAENLNALGIENMRVEYLYPHRFSVEPYHYGDLWLLALAFKIVPIHPIFCSVLVVAPLLNAMVVLGTFAFVSILFKGKKLSVSAIAIVLVGFVGGFSLLFPSFVFPYSVDVYAHSFCNYTKLLWWASLLPLVLILILKKNDESIVFPVFIIGLGYINVLPSILLGSVLWLMYISYSRGVFRRNAILFALVSISVVSFLYAFYAYYPSTQPLVSRASAKADFSLEKVITGLRTSVNIFVGGGLQFAVYLPVFLIWLWLFKTSDSFKKSALINVFVFCILATGSSLLVWSLMSSTTFESIQLFYNVFVVVMGVASAITYVYIYHFSDKKWISILSVLLMAASVYGNRKYDINTTSIDKQELGQLVDFVQKEKQPKFAHYRNNEDYTSDIFGSSTIVAMPLGILSYFVPGYQNFSLNAPFAPLDTNKREYVFQKNNIAWAPIAYFAQQDEHRQLSPSALMLKFVHQQNINFITVPFGVVLPDSLRLLVSDSLNVKGLGWTVYHRRISSTLIETKN